VGHVVRLVERVLFVLKVGHLEVDRPRRALFRLVVHVRLALGAEDVLLRGVVGEHFVLRGGQDFFGL